VGLQVVRWFQSSRWALARSAVWPGDDRSLRPARQVGNQVQSWRGYVRFDHPSPVLRSLLDGATVVRVGQVVGVVLVVQYPSFAPVDLARAVEADSFGSVEDRLCFRGLPFLGNPWFLRDGVSSAPGSSVPGQYSAGLW